MAYEAHQGTVAYLSGNIPELTVILGVVVASGGFLRLGLAAADSIPNVARGLTSERCVAAAVRDRRA